MGPLAVGCGIVLIGLGVGFFFGTGADHVTALIPAFFGIVLAVLGLLARQDRLRKHVMHAAATLGLLGFGLPLWRIVVTLSKEDYKPSAVLESAIMAFLCLVFVLLCVRSFIVARRNRTQLGSKQAPLN